MAYNVGRAHGETKKMTAEAGRAAMLQALTTLVDHIDPGDLARPMIGLIK
jgi:hypothetical protein